MNLQNRLFKIYSKIKNTKYFIHIIIILVILLIYITHRIYVWTQTESTDDAYIQSNISLVSAEVNGIVQEISVKDNSFVSKNQIIAKIDESNYKALYDEARFAYDSAKYDIEVIDQNIKIAEVNYKKSKQSLEFSEINFKIAKSDFDRVKSLSKEKFSSQKSLDDADQLLEKSHNDLIQSRFSLELCELQLELLKFQKMSALDKLNASEQKVAVAKYYLDHTVIRSPIDGKLANSNLEIGNYIYTGSLLFFVVPTKELYVEANFKEIQLSKFYDGMDVELVVDAYPKEKILGKIRNITPATAAKFSLIPPANATGNFVKIVQRVGVLIDFIIPEKLQDKILPGMSTVVSVRTDQKK